MAGRIINTFEDFDFYVKVGATNVRLGKRLRKDPAGDTPPLIYCIPTTSIYSLSTNILLNDGHFVGLKCNEKL